MSSQATAAIRILKTLSLTDKDEIDESTSFQEAQDAGQLKAGEEKELTGDDR